MTAWTTPRDWTTNELVTDTIMNTHVRDNLAVLRADACSVGRSTTQTIPNGDGVSTYLSFDEEIEDSNGMHESVTNPERITIARTGIYAVSASRIKFTAHASGYDYCYVVANSNSLLAEEIRAGNALVDNQFHFCIITKLTAADYVRVLVKQTSGGDLDIKRVANLSPLFSVVLIKDLTT